MAKVTGSRRGRRHATATAVATLTVLLAAGCSSNTSGITLETPSTPSLPSATPPVPPATLVRPSLIVERQRVLAQYLQYTDVIVDAQNLPADKRPAVLRRVVVDPLYTTALRALADRDARGQIPYGKATRSPKVESVKGDAATVRDCIDGSSSGLMNKATGEKLTVGTKRAVYIATIRRGSDDIWRTATYVLQPAKVTC